MRQGNSDRKNRPHGDPTDQVSLLPEKGQKNFVPLYFRTQRWWVVCRWICFQKTTGRFLNCLPSLLFEQSDGVPTICEPSSPVIPNHVGYAPVAGGHAADGSARLDCRVPDTGIVIRR